MFKLPTLLLIIFCNSTLYCASQNNFVENARGGNSFASDADGRPMYQITSYRMEGSPYFYDAYCYAEVTSVKGTIYSGVKVKFNLAENKLLYLTESGAEMEAMTLIKKIKFLPQVEEGHAYEEATLAVLQGAMNVPSAAVYQILEDSTVKLLKLVTINWNDDKPYGEATITRVFRRKESFYAYMPGKPEPQKVEKNKSAVMSLLADKKDPINKFIEAQKYSARNEKELIEIFRYYNSLQ